MSKNVWDYVRILNFQKFILKNGTRIAYLEKCWA